MTDPKLLKLGKKAVKVDKRTFQLRALLKRELPPIPASWNTDHQFGFNLENPMYANDKWGDCVIAARAHQTRRFEGFEQSKVILIKDDEVLKQYYKEGGANCINKRPDNGLVMLTSLNRWRQEGWIVGSHRYNCYAFAQVHPSDMPEIKAAIYLFNGINVGIELPISAQTQDVWDVATGPESDAGSWGGHCVFVNSYDDTGLTCVTWGALKKMTWSFVWRYMSEAYAVLDAKNIFQPDSPLNVDKLNELLKEVS